MRNAGVLVLLLLTLAACSTSKQVDEPPDPLITIVDIGHLDRNGIGKQLAIVNKYSPRVVALNFLLTTDSLDRDLLLARTLAETERLVEGWILHNNSEFLVHSWDSLERYHEKFRFGSFGYVNFTTTDDSVVVEDLPMRQYYQNEPVYAFCYVAASLYDHNQINAVYHLFDRDIVFAPGTVGKFFRIISVEELFAGNFDSADLTDRIVLMGHVGDENSFYLDESLTERISGVEIQASFIRALLSRDEKAGVEGGVRSSGILLD